MSRRRRDDAGVSTVEFALVLPVFVFLVGVAAYFGWMFYIQAQVDRAADRAARYAAVPYTTTTTVQQNIDQNGNIVGVVTAGVTIVNAYSTTKTTTHYNYCVDKVLDKVNSDLFTGKASVDFSTASTVNDDLLVSDGSGVLDKSKACGTPNGYVKVQVKKDFTNPFSIFLSPFTGTTSQLTVTGTGRARVEAE